MFVPLGDIRTSGASAEAETTDGLGRVRVLFGCTGWPCGLLEVASWARHLGLAEPVVFQMQPGDSSGLENAELLSALKRRAQRCNGLREEMGTGSEPMGENRGRTPSGEVPVPISSPVSSQALREAVSALGGAFARKLLLFHPHVVGFRLEADQWPQVQRFVAAVRLLSDAEIVLGGPTATSHPGPVLDQCEADYVFIGEAEATFAQFLRLAWQQNSTDQQPTIPGLAYRYGGRTYVNTLPRDGYERTVFDAEPQLCSKILRCLRGTVRPAATAELILANRLDWSLLENFTAPLDGLRLNAGRGCPGACTFCAKLHGNEVRNKTPQQLMDEIEAAHARSRSGGLRVQRQRLYRHVADADLAQSLVAWADIYDEDFFLDRHRAAQFFRAWEQSDLRKQYRLRLHANPASLLDTWGRVHGELLAWIDALKPMIHLGATSLNDEVLARWRKPHTAAQVRIVLDALDRTEQDYAFCQLLTDYDTTPEELIETLRLLILEAFQRPSMRVVVTPLTTLTYDSPVRKSMEFGGRLPPERVGHFTDYELPQPGWMQPLAAELAVLADVMLQAAGELEHRDAALLEAFASVVARLPCDGPGCGECELRHQAERAMEQLCQARGTAQPSMATRTLTS